MTAIALLAELHRRGVVLTPDGDRLRYRAPAGMVTPELKDAMRERKGELLVLLSGGEGEQGHPFGPTMVAALADLWVRLGCPAGVPIIPATSRR